MKHPHSSFLRQQAVDCTQKAKTALLQNIRDQNLQSAEAWRAMADQAEEREAARDAPGLDASR